MVAKRSSIRRVAWMTDIHLEFLTPDQIDAFLVTVAEEMPHVILITGDIMPAPGLRQTLRYMAQKLLTPIYVVLGNHDFYRGDIAPVREEMAELTRAQSGVAWMPAVGVLELAPGIGLVGHDGWADGRLGDYMKSPILLNDYAYITTLKIPDQAERWEQLQRLGDQAGDYLRGILPEAARRYSQVYVMIHQPPFQEACWYQGKTPDWDNPYLPHFTCKAAGDALLDAAETFPDVQFTVLCGHVHHAGEATIRDNLHVITGGAEYGNPTVQRVFEFAMG